MTKTFKPCIIKPDSSPSSVSGNGAGAGLGEIIDCRLALFEDWEINCANPCFRLLLLPLLFLLEGIFEVDSEATLCNFSSTSTETCSF